MKKTIYLTGPVKDRGISQLTEFRLAQEKLEGLGFDVTTAIDEIPSGDAFNVPENRSTWLALRKKHLEEADIILTMPQYECDEQAIAEKREARHDGRMRTLMGVVEFIEKYTHENTATTADQDATR